MLNRLIPPAALAVAATLATTLAATLAQPVASAVPPAAYRADVDHVPVAVDDAITVWAGTYETPVNVMRNDSDVDGRRDLEICRLEETYSTDVLVERLDGDDRRGRMLIETEPQASGDYTVGYQLCDYSYLVPATLTVTVKPVGVTTVTKRPGHPRQLRVTNTDQHTIWVIWGRFQREEYLGIEELAPGETKDVVAGARNVDWGAGFAIEGPDPEDFEDDTEVTTGYGTVRGLKSPRHRAGRLARVAAPSALTALTHRRGHERTASYAARDVPADPAADPTTVAPPVPGPDEVTWWAGAHGGKDVLANDADPAGADLDICRVGRESGPVGAYSNDWDGLLQVGSRGHRGGTYKLTYYACNQHRLAPGTVTVHLRRVRPVKLAVTADGRIRIDNRNRHGVRVSFQDVTEEGRDERTFRIGPRAVRYVRLPSGYARWSAEIGHPRSYIDGGYFDELS